jgi:DNA-binding NarL/FixJ family response regulator
MERRPRGDDRTRVVVVSDHGLLRDCLAASLEETGRFAAVGLSADLGAAEAAGAVAAADLLVVDLPHPAADEFDRLAELSRDRPHLRVVVLAADLVAADVLRCRRAGVAAYLPRDIPLSELLAALAAVLAGATACDPELAAGLFARLTELAKSRARREEMALFDLTPRQMQVLRLIALGLGNEEIGRRLHVSRHTVKNHVHNILGQLRVRDRAEAVAHAYRRRWLP